jgi:hypothetical protein
MKREAILKGLNRKLSQAEKVRCRLFAVKLETKPHPMVLTRPIVDSESQPYEVVILFMGDFPIIPIVAKRI